MGKHVVRLLLLLWFATSVFAADKGWVEVRTAHFHVISNGSERQAVDVAEGFEQIHAAFAQGFPHLRTDSGAETIVVAAKDEFTMESLLPPAWKKKGMIKPAGLFHKGWEKDYALVRLDTFIDSYHVVYHEYIHKLVGLNFARLPVWLNEGLAEFFGTARFEKNRTLLGVPNVRISILRQKTPYPLEKLLAADGSSPYYRDADKAQMFYAESWGLTHFLMFGDGMGNGAHLNQFLRDLQSGMEQQKAFEQAFGHPEEIDRNFRRYVMRFAFTGFALKPPVHIDKSTFAVRQMSPAETNAMLGTLYLYFGLLEEAEKKLSSALADSSLALAHENMAFLHFREGRDEEAGREFDRALELNPKSFLALYYKAMLANGGKTDAESLAKLDGALERVLQLNPVFAPALIERSRIYVRKQDFKRAMEMAVRAEELEPDRAGYHLNTAEILLLGGYFEEAIKTAAYVAARWRGGPDSAEALALLQRARAAARLTASPEEKARETEFMKYATGTETAEGTIESVACGKQDTSKIVLRTATGKREFRRATDAGWGMSDTIWYGGDHFDGCHHLEGMQGVVRYKAGKDGQPEIQWLEVRDDIVPGRPATEIVQGSTDHR